MEEPYIKATIITKSDFVGNVMSLCIEKRGQITNQTYLTTERVELTFDMPLAEIVFDFYDRLKTVSKGYASFDYAPIGMRESKLVRLDVLLNGNIVDAFLLYCTKTMLKILVEKCVKNFANSFQDNSLISQYKLQLAQKLFPEKQ